MNATANYKLTFNGKVVSELSRGGYDVNPDASSAFNASAFAKHYSEIADEVFEAFGFTFNNKCGASYLTGYGKKVFTFKSTYVKNPDSDINTEMDDFYTHKCECMKEFMIANNLKLETL